MCEYHIDNVLEEYLGTTMLEFDLRYNRSSER